MKPDDFPCWLQPKDRAIALALIEKAEFIYIGRLEDFIFYDEEWGTGYKLLALRGWRLASANGEVALEAICDGAVFGKCLETIPNMDFEQEVQTVKQTIKAAYAEYYQQSEFTQLSLF